MYCPKCGQSQVSADVRFCSRCGFPLLVVGDLLVTGGVLPAHLPMAESGGAAIPESRRRRGMKRGIGILLFGILLLPFFGILHEAVGTPLEFMTFALLAIMAGFIRLILAAFFEESAPHAPKFASLPQPYTPPIASRLHATAQDSLPSAQGIPVNDYRPPQVHTAEMMRPPSVTDHTTRLLDKQTDSAEQ